jgi:hypothetical protein
MILSSGVQIHPQLAQGEGKSQSFLEQKSTRTSDFGTKVSAPTSVPNCFQVPKQVPREECTNVPKQVPKQQVTPTGSNVETIDRWREGKNKVFSQKAAT